MSLKARLFFAALRAPPLRAVLHGRLARSIRPSDVFIVTYPKSGTTWLTFLIANMLRRESGAPLDLQTCGRYVPEINGIYNRCGSLRDYAALPDPRVFVAHAPYTPLFPKVVYMLRDPRDVLVSYYHHQRLTDPDFRDTLQDFATRRFHFPCPWDEHVAGWLLARRNPRILPVRYEDMLLNAAEVLGRVVRFAGIPCVEVDLLRAVEASRFERMRSAEERFGFTGAKGSQAERFVRRGKSGGWRDELDDSTVRKIEARFGPVMRRVGYDPTTDIGFPGGSP